jgi:hypothetical protein
MQNSTSVLLDPLLVDAVLDDEELVDVELEAAVELPVDAVVELAATLEDSEEAVEPPPVEVSLEATDEAVAPVDAVALVAAELLALLEWELEDFLATSSGEPESGVDVLELLEQAVAVSRREMKRLRVGRGIRTLLTRTCSLCADGDAGASLGRATWRLWGRAARRSSSRRRTRRGPRERGGSGCR